MFNRWCLLMVHKDAKNKEVLLHGYEQEATAHIEGFLVGPYKQERFRAVDWLKYKTALTKKQIKNKRSVLVELGRSTSLCFERISPLRAPIWPIIGPTTLRPSPLFLNLTPKWAIFTGRRLFWFHSFFTVRLAPVPMVDRGTKDENHGQRIKE